MKLECKGYMGFSRIYAENLNSSTNSKVILARGFGLKMFIWYHMWVSTLWCMNCLVKSRPFGLAEDAKLNLTAKRQLGMRSVPTGTGTKNPKKWVCVWTDI